MKPRTTAIVPTVGASRWLSPCLEALRAAGGDDLEIVLVAQGRTGVGAAGATASLVDRTLRLEVNAGFAAANNRALAEARGELVATVNDDVLVEPSWYRALVAALDAEPRAAAAQGVNLDLREPRLADGCGLRWNRWWQAVQIARGEPAPAATQPAVEVFGVSATAAIYRLEALRAAAADAGDGLAVFDARLVSYYEDVDLACRLRAAGHRALLAPAARALHAGSASGRRLALSGWPLVYGNRHLVLARLLGRAYFSALPLIGGRDALDLLQALGRGRLARAAGVTGGWARAAWLLAGYLRTGPPAIPLAELRR